MNKSADRSEQQAHWQRWITRWQASGLSQAAFCDTHDLVYHQFTYWRRKAAIESYHASPTPSGFVAVQRLDHAPSGLILTLPNGIQLQGFTAHNLTLLPQLLAHLS